MVCGHGGFIIQSHNELRDLEAEMLKMVCNDVEVEPVLQEITGEVLTRGTNKAPGARLDIHARGFWEGQNLHSLTSGCATQMQILIKTSALSKYIASTKTRRNVCMLTE